MTNNNVLLTATAHPPVERELHADGIRWTLADAAPVAKTVLWWLVACLPFAWQDRAAALVRWVWPGVRDA